MGSTDPKGLNWKIKELSTSQVILQYNMIFKIVFNIIQVNVSLSELICETNYKNLLLPSIYKNAVGKNSAEEMCHKLEENSTLKHFTSEKQYEEFFKKFKDMPALETECWQESRKLIWMPYVDPDQDFVFTHLQTGETVYPSNGAWMAGKYL